MLFGRLSRGLAVAAVAGVLGLAPSPTPGAEPRPWRIDGGDVTILVPLKPGGAFEAKTSSLQGTLTPGASQPLSLSGELAVDLASIDTGISLRDRHLRENYLEVARGRGYDRAVLSDIVLSQANGEGFRGQTELTGTLLLHGVSQALTGKADIQDADSGVAVEAEFVLTLTDYAIEPPEYMGVGVTNRVAVRVLFVARAAGRGR